MKLRTVFAAALAALAMATACKKEDPAPSNGDQDRLIKVRASVYNFVKATDTAFEEGDEIGVNIFKEDEAYLYNAKFTYTLGALTPDTPHKWYKEDVEAVITAVYPHNDAVNEYAATESFTVNSDQTEFVKYQASDLLLAKTASRPTESAVTLPFKHALSKISVTLDSKLEEEVENVWFTDLYGTVTYDPKNPFETLAAAGETGTVKAYKSGDNTWVLIVAPQENANPKLAVTTASGKQYTYTLEEAVSFGSGKLNTATVTVEETSIYTSFTPEITDWTADKELNFSQNEEDVVLPDQGGEGEKEEEGEIQNMHMVFLDPNDNWATSNARFVAYSWADGIEATWTDMTDTDGDGVYGCTILGTHTSVIFCRMNPSVSENRWNKDTDTDESKPLWNQSPDLTVPTGKEICYKIDEGVWNKDGEPAWSGSWVIYENI